MSYTAVIVAGGSGTRMGAEQPKQFIELNDKPLFLYSIDSFLKAIDDISIVLVMPEDYLQTANSILLRFAYPLTQIKIIPGGKTRFHSVQRGLDAVDPASIVFVHDAVRCLVSSELIRKCAEQCSLHRSAVPAIPVRDSIRSIDQHGNSSVLDRNNLRIIQTPQTFFASDLKKAFQTDYMESFTDEASVAEHHGMKIHLITGEESNIKITFPEDLAFAEWMLSQKTT
jgi:2-C-methyl-D-erythritol 4-phosphate cytidylyltransferase